MVKHRLDGRLKRLQREPQAKEDNSWTPQMYRNAGYEWTGSEWVEAFGPTEQAQLFLEVEQVLSDLGIEMDNDPTDIVMTPEYMQFLSEVERLRGEA